MKKKKKIKIIKKLSREKVGTPPPTKVMKSRTERRKGGRAQQLKKILEEEVFYE